MRLIDADAVWDWYIKEFSEEHLGDRAIKPNECRFSMYDIVGNLNNIPEIDIDQYAKEHNLFICTTNIIEQIREEIQSNFENSTDPINIDAMMRNIGREDCLEIIEKYTKGEKNG